MTTIERLDKVMARTGIGKSTVYRLISEGKFPRPVPLGARAVGFLSEEVDAWIDARVAARDQALGRVRASRRAASRIHGGDA